MREQSWQRFRGTGRWRAAGRYGPARAVAALAVGAVALGIPAPAVAHDAGPGATAQARPDAVQRGLSDLVRTDGQPGALAAVVDGKGRTRTYTAGAGDISTGAKVPADGRVRIGSSTKTFTAVVVLQLVGEGRIGLDTKVDTHLPGLLRGKGIDGRDITVRELLQHTSGLPEYEDLVDEDILDGRHLDPRDLLDRALRREAAFAPGTGWAYSSTNYVVAGLIVQKVTGRPLAEEIDRRVIKPAGLRDTYFPAPGEKGIRGPHPHGYRREAPGGPLRDVTRIDPSGAWAAGQMVSTNADLNRFFTAVLDGSLLKEPQLTQMRTTVPIGDTGAGYGLGIMSRPLSCGGVYWGHGGDIAGFETRGGVTEAGHRAVAIAVTSVPPDGPPTKHLEVLVDTALCG
ncbi:serine hydrolase domain-containing protein [Streptomyces sp. NPDC048507]|uniref:serine hydrolase domain-containing protein n=1 Tax=Streptomyces sp. NPDC048507 TaxID=3365560 RepID=UPI00371CC630